MLVHNYSLNWTAGHALRFELATPAAASYFRRWAAAGQPESRLAGPKAKWYGLRER